MKKLSFILIMIVPLLVTAPLHAVTYPFPEKVPRLADGDTVMTVGSRVYLFQSNTKEVRKAITVNDVLTVYRKFPPDISPESREVGKVRVLLPLGDYYFGGEVIEGEVLPGNLATKGDVACFVTSFITVHN